MPDPGEGNETKLAAGDDPARPEGSAASDPKKDDSAAGGNETRIAGQRVGAETRLAPSADRAAANETRIAERPLAGLPGAETKVAPGVAGEAAAGGQQATQIAEPGKAGPPLRYGDFRVVAELGAGAMGIVYQAQQLINEQPSRTVALKVLKPELSHEPSFEERFFREALHALNLRHPNIVQGIHAKKENGVCYMAMEFVDGETLNDRVGRDGPLDVGDALEIVRDVARGLQHAHESGVFHRDVKPGNVMVSRSGEVKVTDLGLAKAPATDLGLTAYGQLVGTPIYMAPEQSDEPDEPDARYDVYALGGTLFFLLTGQVPFRGQTPRELQSEKQHKVPPAARALRPDLPAAVDGLLAKMLAPDPRQRLASMKDVVAAIDATGLANDTLSWIPRGSETDDRARPGFLSRHGGKLGLGGGLVVALGVAAALWRESAPVAPQPQPPTAVPRAPTAAKPATAFIAAAMENLAAGRSAAAYDELRSGLQAHPENAALERLSAETRDGVVELFQTRDASGQLSPPQYPPIAGRIALEPGSSFRPGVLLSQKCHVYVLYADPVGDVSWLFFGGLMDPKLHWIRSPRDEFFARDTLSGASTFYVIAVTQPLADPDGVVRPLAAENPDELRRRLASDPDSLLEKPRGENAKPGRSCFATQPLASFEVYNR